MTNILDKSVLGEAFPDKQPQLGVSQFSLIGPLSNIACDPPIEFGAKSPFENVGLVIGRTVFTQKHHPYFKGKKAKLADVLLDEQIIDSSFLVDKKDLAKWRKYRNGKAALRTNFKSGETYLYKCGRMRFPDPIDRPSRTIITGEGGRSASRTTHIIATKNNRFRRLMPIELERLNMFPDNHTAEATNVQRGFLMGNALVVGIVELIGRELAKQLSFKLS